MLQVIQERKHWPFLLGYEDATEFYQSTDSGIKDAEFVYEGFKSQLEKVGPSIVVKNAPVKIKALEVGPSIVVNNASQD